MTISKQAILNADSVVVNVVMYDDEGAWSPPAGHTIVPAPSGVGMGGTYRDGVFTDKAVPTPVATRVEKWAAASTTKEKFAMLEDLLHLKEDGAPGA